MAKSPFRVVNNAASLAALSKLYLDGVAASGDTYLVESSANVMDLYAGGAKTLSLSSTGAAVVGTLSSTGKATLGAAAGGEQIATTSVTTFSGGSGYQSFYSEGAERLRVGWKNAGADTGLVPAQILMTGSVDLTLASRDNAAASVFIKAGSGIPTVAAFSSSGLAISGNLVLPKTSGKGIQVDTAAPTWGWKDLFGILRPDTGGANAPTLAASRGGRCREFFYSAGDKMDMDFHIPHDYVPGTDIYIHFHWGHNGTAISGSIVAEFSYTYAKGHQQAIFAAEKMVTITVSTPNIATIPQHQHNVSEVVMSSAGGSATLLDNALIEPDGVIQMNMAIATIPTITGGSTNEPYVMYADIHYQSTSVGTKQKAPGFYT